MYAIIKKTKLGEENISERSGVGYYADEDKANWLASQVHEGGTVVVRSVNETYMSAQGYLSRMKGNK